MTGSPAVTTDLVTGAFGNTGSAIASILRRRGVQVRTLTNHPPPQVPDQPAPFDPADGDLPHDDDLTHDEGPALEHPPEARAVLAEREGHRRGGRRQGSGSDEPEGPPIEARPHAFGDADALAAAFEGVRTFYNTYWIRTGDSSGYASALARSKELIDAAAAAGVERIVHMSVLGASEDAPYPYFRAKAEVEEHGRNSGVPFAAVRPALIFGGSSALLSNLAWMLRRLPVMGVAGDGTYRVRPVHVEDVADICVDLADRDLADLDGTVVDAVGPDRPTYDELIRHVRTAVGGRARIVHLPVPAVVAGARVLGWILEDEVLTRDELVSTMAGIADTDGPATGATSVIEWIHRRGATLGRDWQPAAR